MTDERGLPLRPGMLKAKLKALAKCYLPSRLVRHLQKDSIRLSPVRVTTDSWLAKHLRLNSVQVDPRLFERIEELARKTEELGQQPLWTGFSDVANYPTPVGEGATRSSEDVRTRATIGRFFATLVVERQPRLIVEFGTAFGISGMYWLAGLETNGSGHLLTFEPNLGWAKIAEANLAALGKRFTLTAGTFEDNLAVVDQRPDKIDLCFIDAIHTSEFVLRQLDLVRRRAAPGALILFDDIDFSDDMRSCWQSISSDMAFAGAATIGNVGVIELRK